MARRPAPAARAGVTREIAAERFPQIIDFRRQRLYGTRVAVITGLGSADQGMFTPRHYEARPSVARHLEVIDALGQRAGHLVVGALFQVHAKMRRLWLDACQHLVDPLSRRIFAWT